MLVVVKLQKNRKIAVKFISAAQVKLSKCLKTNVFRKKVGIETFCAKKTNYPKACHWSQWSHLSPGSLALRAPNDRASKKTLSTFGVGFQGTNNFQFKACFLSSVALLATCIEIVFFRKKVFFAESWSLGLHKVGTDETGPTPPHPLRTRARMLCAPVFCYLITI